MDRADAEVQAQPLAQEFLNPRPRQPQPQGQRHDQRRQPGSDEPPLAQLNPRQQWVHHPGPATARVVCPQVQRASW